MQMTKDDIKKYPKLYQYVSCQIPLVANVGVIVNAIKKLAGTIDRSTITNALQWGKGPMLKIVDFPKGLYGEFSPGVRSNELRLSKAMVEKFEKGKGLVTAPNGKKVYLVGVTILHELTHWADDQDGVDTLGEEGNQFESLVYGGFVADPDI